MTAELPGLIYFGLACLAALFQSALAMGAPLGQWTLGGMYPGRLPAPQRAAAAVQSTLLLAMGMVIAGAAGQVGWEPPRWAVWGTVAINAISAVGTLVTPSPQERRLWAPVTLAMLAAAGFVAFVTRG